MKFTEIAKHFNPAWFAAVMGTAVIPLVLSLLDFPGKEFLGVFFFLAAALMFLLALVPLTVKFFLYRGNIAKDLNHPVAAHFLPTMPISLVILAMDFLKYPNLLLLFLLGVWLAVFLRTVQGTASGKNFLPAH